MALRYLLAMRQAFVFVYIAIISIKISNGDGLMTSKDDIILKGIPSNTNDHDSATASPIIRTKRVTTDPGDGTFWANRGRRTDPKFIEENFDIEYEKRQDPEGPFWGNRGKRYGDSEDIKSVEEIHDDVPVGGCANRTRREESDPFWGNRGRRADDEPQFWGNRGKKEVFWGNRGKKDDTPQFWGNRGKKDDVPQFWGNRGKKDDEPQFWGNRGRRSEEERQFWGNRGKKDDVFWGNRGKKDDVFWGNRGKKEDVFWGNRGRRHEDNENRQGHVNKKHDEPFWGNRGKRFNKSLPDRKNVMEPFWGNRGKKSPIYNKYLTKIFNDFLEDLNKQNPANFDDDIIYPNEINLNYV